jgi:uncharacterized protein YuzE
VTPVHKFEVTFLDGQPFVAYLYLPRKSGQMVDHSDEVVPDVVVDFDAAGNAMGVEILRPEMLTLTSLNDVLLRLGAPPVTPADLAPLKVA